MGFSYVAYQGLETGHRDFTSHVVRNNDIVYVFQTAVDPASCPEF